MAFSMIFAADVVPTKSNVEAFCEGKMETLIDDGIFSYWKDADFRFLNLEVPLTDVETPIKKCGPALIAPTASVRGYKQLDPTLLGLCNNHILDQDEAGLADTIRTLEENGIAYTGVGENIKTAWKPYIYEKDGKKIGIYSCAEHEFTLATDTRAGANPFEPLDSLDHIADLKKECDYVIVVYHGGKEHYRYPSPRLKKAMHKIIDKGADFVTCQHTHCISCMEEYGGGTILYGQGNFLFDLVDREEWQTGLLVKLTFDDGLKVEYFPVQKDGEKIRKPSAEEEKAIMDGFYERSRQILDDGFVKKSYAEFCLSLAEEYFTDYERLSGSTRKLADISPRELQILRSYFYCEPHAELITTAINELAGLPY